MWLTARTIKGIQRSGLRGAMHLTSLYLGIPGLLSVWHDRSFVYCFAYRSGGGGSAVPISVDSQKLMEKFRFSIWGWVGG